MTDKIEHSPLPWFADPDDRDGMEWNIHIVEHDRPHMRICFMSRGDESAANAALIVKACNAHAKLVAALEKIASGTEDTVFPFRCLPDSEMKRIARDALASLKE